MLAYYIVIALPSFLNFDDMFDALYRNPECEVSIFLP